MLNPLKYFSNRKVGLALGSGGAKGLAHIAVIDYLQAMGVPISMIAGSSIGAVIGAVYASGTLPAFTKDIKQMTKKGRMALIDPVFPTSGLISGNKFMKYLTNYIPADAKIEHLSVPLAITATDLTTGKSVIFQRGNVLEAVRASVSIPGVITPVRYKNRFLVDGGVANPLPVNVLKTMGAGITIAVNLHPRPAEKGLKDYVKDNFGSSIILENAENIEAPPEVRKQEIAYDKKSFMHLLSFVKSTINRVEYTLEYPSIFEVIFESVNIMEYVNTQLMLRYNPPAILVEPYLPSVGTLDFEEAPAILAEGYRAVSALRNQIIRKVKL